MIVKRLSDRVRHWMTLNEAQCFIGLGHSVGIHAPGIKLDWPEVMRGWHNSLLAHGKAVQVIRGFSKLPSVIGAAPTGFIAHPATESAADIEAARLATFTVHEKSVWNQHMFYDPIYRKEYPPEAAAVFGNAMPQVKTGDMEIIGQPIDFSAFNYLPAARFRCRTRIIPGGGGRGGFPRHKGRPRVMQVRGSLSCCNEEVFAAKTAAISDRPASCCRLLPLRAVAGAQDRRHGQCVPGSYSDYQFIGLGVALLPTES